MIIVEGPDGAGKTTLIEKLNHHRVHLKSLKGGVGSEGQNPQGWAANSDSTLSAYASKILEAERVQAVNIAFDRFHLSEWVYGPILRNTQLITEDVLEMLGNLLREKHVPIILCLPEFKTTLANVNRDGRERPSYQTEGFLHMAYVAWQKIAPFATIVYDYEKDALPIVASHAD